MARENQPERRRNLKRGFGLQNAQNLGTRETVTSFLHICCSLAWSAHVTNINRRGYTLRKLHKPQYITHSSVCVPAGVNVCVSVSSRVCVCVCKYSHLKMWCVCTCGDKRAASYTGAQELAILLVWRRAVSH